MSHPKYLTIFFFTVMNNVIYQELLVLNHKFDPFLHGTQSVSGFRVFPTACKAEQQ